MKHATTKLFALCIGLMTTAAQAEVYMGAGGGVVVYDVQGIHNAAAGSVTLGYRNRTPFFVEATGHGTGRSRIDGLTNRIQTLGGGLSLGLRAPLDNKGSGLFIKGGYYLATVRNYIGVNGGNPYVKDKGDGVSYGLGAEWYFTRNFGIRTDIEVYDNLDLFGSTVNATFLNLSLLAAFGGSDPTSAPAAVSTQPVYRSYTPVETRQVIQPQPYYAEPAPQVRGPYIPTVPYSSQVEEPDVYVPPVQSGEQYPYSPYY